jgi:hypothetical protein
MRDYFPHLSRCILPRTPHEVLAPTERPTHSGPRSDAVPKLSFIVRLAHLERSARLITFSALGVLALSFRVHAQFEFLGLHGHAVRDLSDYWNGKIYAATDQGVYVRPAQVGDTTWTLIGLKGKFVRAVYPHDFGALSYAVTAGVQRKPGDPDSTLIYCSRYGDSNWVSADTGIDRTAISSIRSISGFPSPLICGETFAGGEGKVYLGVSGVWEKVFDIGIGAVNVVAVDLRTVSVWVGGETGIFAPFIAHSKDKGSTWTTTLPDLAGDNACNSLCFDPTDTSLVYGGMEGSVINSTDGGMTWSATGLQGTSYYFYGLVYDASTSSLFAGGTTSTGDPGLFMSRNQGSSWDPLELPLDADGILCMTLIPTMIPEQNMLLIGTLTSGVLSYRIPPTSVADKRSPTQFSLRQNYPNPFNPSTTIEYEVGEASHAVRHTVQLAVFDLLGRYVATLVDEEQESGPHHVAWKGIAADGRPVSSGMYVCRLVANGYSRSRTMILLR